MSNHKYAYGWSGHILTRESQADDDALAQNVVSIPDDLFDRIADDHGNIALPAGVRMEQLGWLSSETVNFLASGSGFTEGWRFYGAPFEEAELRLEGAPLAVDADAEYLAVMNSHYGLELPPCRLMIGCASEH